MIRHFEAYGDKSPDSLENKMSICHRNEVFKQYCSEMEQSGEKLVKKNRFYEIWSSLFPYVVNRPWCDIPGKCKICHEIDKLRKLPTLWQSSLLFKKLICCTVVGYSTKSGQNIKLVVLKLLCRTRRIRQ